ncbi:putative Histidine kinase [Rhodovastum atsumiense]|nr:PAS domain S-box protein [Rhodovastum atsumiense]CAH2602247.1 putative Histidine kinase [Rhodovastum atsumiense]
MEDLDPPVLTGERQFALLAEAATELAMLLLDREGRVAGWNAGAQRFLGYADPEVIGRHVEIFFAPEERARDRPRELLRAAATGDRVETEAWQLRQDGTTFRAHLTLAAVRDGDGRLCGFAKVLRDVTPRRRLEERLRQIVESAPSAIVMVNATGRIEMVNAQTERLFGYDRQDLIGQMVEILVPPPAQGRHPGLRHGFFRDPRARPMGAGRDLYARRKDGSTVPVEIGLSPVETEDGPMVLSAIVDISDRKHKEERIQAALLEKDVLLGEIHHRVKNNLQIVHSLLDLGSARIEDRRALEMLRESQNRIRSMALIHQNLYESKDFANTDFATFLEKMVPILVSSYAVDPARIAVITEAVSVRLPINLAIPCGLVVNELVSNALKHAFPDGRSGEIRIRLAMDGAEHVVLSVSDDGIGMQADLDLGLSETLGLQLVTLLADQLGCEPDVHPANPTRFTLRFPARH